MLPKEHQYGTKSAQAIDHLKAFINYDPAKARYKKWEVDLNYAGGLLDQLELGNGGHYRNIGPKDGYQNYYDLNPAWSGNYEAFKTNQIAAMKADAQARKLTDTDNGHGSCKKKNNDNPDDNFDVSTYLQDIYNDDTNADVAIISNGFSASLYTLLLNINETSSMEEVGVSLDTLKNYSVLVIPSGGLYGLDSSPAFKYKLEKYVSNGGTLIAFSQQHGYEYNALPGGGVSGFGWLEDQSCQWGSVGITTYLPIFSGQDSPLMDVNVDGYFTKYPENATVLLSRTKNGMPAMLMYNYGKGRVIATTAYPDWAYDYYAGTQDETNMVRDLISWAKNPEEIPDYGENDAIDIPINITNNAAKLSLENYTRYNPGDTVNIPVNISYINYTKYHPGDTANISVDVTNYNGTASEKIRFYIFDADYNPVDHRDIPVIIALNETKTINFTYTIPSSSKPGMWVVEYSLLDTNGNQILSNGLNGLVLTVTNITDITPAKLLFSLYDPEYNFVDQVNTSISIALDETKVVNFTYKLPNSSIQGVWFVKYTLINAKGEVIQDNLGGELFAVEFGNLTADKVVFIVRSPDKNIYGYVNVSTFINLNETKTIHFIYTAPSKPGIWSIDYSLLNNGNAIQNVKDAQRFAVSKYARNPNGWIYQGSKISFSITSDAEEYPYGSPALFTFHIWNRGSTDKNITVTWGSIHHSWYGIIPPGWDNALSNTISVPKEGYSSFTYTLSKVVDLDRFRAKFYDGSSYLGSAEKGFYMIRPSLNINIKTDKNEYAKGENGTISLNFKNMQSVAYNATVAVKVLNPDNSNIFEKNFDLNISASSTEDRNIEFSIPRAEKDGIYLVKAEAFKDTNKIGSNSTFFKVSKNYIIKFDFDNPSGTYKIRQNMGMDVSLSNTAASILNTRINISIPDINFNESKNITVNPNQTEKIHFGVSLPENLSSGKHTVAVTVGLDNYEYNFFIPDSKLVISLDKLNFNAGDEVSIDLTNRGGVDTAFNYSIKFYDPYNAMIHNNSGEETVLSGGSKIIRFKIPGGITSGDYRLIITGKDVKTNEFVSLWKSLHINGFNVILTSSTDKKGYYVDENISALTNLVNLNGDIIDGILNLKIYSSGQLTSMRADSRGKEFFLVNTENYYSGYESAIFITSEVNTSGLVEIPGIVFTRSFAVTANKITTVNVPTNSMVSGSNRIENKGIRVTANDDIAVYFLNPGVPVYTNDAYLGLPTDILDQEYLVLTYQDTLGGYPSEIAIAAPYNDTIITIIPSITTGTRIAKVPYTVGLNQSQTYTLQSDNLNEDLTGTVIQSNQPISVFAGVKCVNIPAGYGYCDHIVEQLTPTSTWGKNIDAFPFKPRQNNKGDFLRILASVNNTTVTINGSVAGTINRGQFLETIIKKPVEISASEPVLVSQYMTGSSYEGRIGDPSSSLVTPVEQFLSEYTFLVPIRYAENYVNILAPSSSLNDLLLDGYPVNAGVFSSYGTKGLSAGTISLSEGSHTIKGSAPFGIYVYGYNQDVSYAYPGGLALRTLRGSLVWEKNIKLNLSKSETKNPVNLIDISKEMPNLVGRFDLLASLYSNSSQKINQSNVYSFFITDQNTSFTLETDKKIYKPNEPITIYGTVQNNGAITRTYNLSLKASDAVIFTDTIILNSGETHNFTKGTTSNKSFTLEGTVDGTTITELVKIENPSINVTINSPDIVDRKEFDVGVLIKNTGVVPVDLGISINNTWNITIAENESRYIETKMKIDKNTTLNVTISGDINQIIHKEIIFGERAKITLAPQSMYLEGTTDIPFEVKNTGVFDSEFNATFSIDGKAVTKAIYIPKYQTINDSISFNLTKGKYLLEYTSPFEKGNATINVATGPEFITLGSRGREYLCPSGRG